MDELPFIIFLILLLKDLQQFMKIYVMEKKFSWAALIGMILTFIGAVLTLNTIIVGWIM